MIVHAHAYKRHALSLEEKVTSLFSTRELSSHWMPQGVLNSYGVYTLRIVLTWLPTLKSGQQPSITLGRCMGKDSLVPRTKDYKGIEATLYIQIMGQEIKKCSVLFLCLTSSYSYGKFLLQFVFRVYSLHCWAAIHCTHHWKEPVELMENTRFWKYTFLYIHVP